MDATARKQDVERVRWDDPEAFRAFYRDALPQVYGYFLHRCGGVASVAEDLTQDTFLAAIAELRRGTEVVAPFPWVLGIARHKLLDHYRRQGRVERLIAPWNDALERRLADDRLPVPTADEEATREWAMAALAAVPVAQREALVLRHVDGLSVPDMAALLGRSVHAVESLLARGRASFRRHYLRLEVDDGAG